MTKIIKILISIFVLIAISFALYIYWLADCTFDHRPRIAATLAPYPDETQEDYSARIWVDPIKEKEDFYKNRPNWCNYFDSNKNA